MGNNYCHFTKYDRIRLESWLRAGMSIKFIAAELNKNPSSVYREIRRGAYEHILYDLSTETRYSSDLADDKYRNNLKEKGSGLKIGSNLDYARCIEFFIHEKKYSPAAALAYIRLNYDFDVDISKTTLYRYIDNDLFLTLTNKDLPVKRNKNKRHHKFVRAKRMSKGKSIEQRPSDVLLRDSFGHWEMDCVVGKKKTKNLLLVFTERLTRKELIFKMPGKDSGNVPSVIDILQNRLGSSFGSIFRTITCDNGIEFSDYRGITHDSSGNERVQLFYCHPYCSCERGSNENQNKLIRRHFPKGYNFTHTSKKEIKRVEDWINNYPREMFGWRSSNDIFNSILSDMGISLDCI